MVGMHLEWVYPGTEADDYEAIIALTGMNDVPPGGADHAHGRDDPDGRLPVFDVWESRDDIEHFFGEVLMPAVHAVLGANPEPPTITEVFELRALVRPGCA